MRDTAEGKLRHEQVMYLDRCVRIRDFRKPTIAAVQGACAAAGLMLAWLAAPVVAPLYDGVGFPDEPYRYVTRPAGDTKVTKPPGQVAVRMPVSDGTTDGFNGASAETGPQISIFVPTGTLAVPKDAHTLLLRADPRTPDGAADGGSVDGNIYRLTATPDTGKASVAKVPDQIQIIMRATTAKQPGPTMEYRPDGRQAWSRLKTSRYGTDLYAATVKGFGDYALVFAKPVSGVAKAAAKSGPAKYAYALIVAGLLIFLSSVVLAIRVARARRAALE